MAFDRRKLRRLPAIGDIDQRFLTLRESVDLHARSGLTLAEVVASPERAAAAIAELLRQHDAFAVRVAHRARLRRDCKLKPRACGARVENPDCECLNAALDAIAGSRTPDPKLTRKAVVADARVRHKPWRPQQRKPKVPPQRKPASDIAEEMPPERTDSVSDAMEAPTVGDSVDGPDEDVYHPLTGQLIRRARKQPPPATHDPISGLEFEDAEPSGFQRWLRGDYDSSNQVVDPATGRTRKRRWFDSTMDWMDRIF